MKIVACWHHRSHARLQKPASTNFPICLTSRLGGHDTTNPSFLFLVPCLSLLHQRQSIRPILLFSSLGTCALPIAGPEKGTKGQPLFQIRSGQAFG